MKFFLMIVLAGTLVPSSAALAHHGAASFFDQTRTIEVKGTVKEWRFVNPHPVLRLEVTEPSGDKVDYVVSFGPAGATILRRRGFSAATFRVGEVIIAKGNPSRAPGSRGIDGSATREDGRPIP